MTTCMTSTGMRFAVRVGHVTVKGIDRGAASIAFMSDLLRMTGLRGNGVRLPSGGVFIKCRRAFIVQRLPIKARLCWIDD